VRPSVGPDILMCQMLYIATDRELPEQTRHRLTVQAITADLDAKLAPTFGRPFRRFVGVDGGCSCDFPSLPMPMEYCDGIFQGESEEEREHAVACVRSLMALVSDALESSESVELYPAWADHEALPPKGRIALRVEDVVPEEFFFIERYLYDVRHQ